MAAYTTVFALSESEVRACFPDFRLPLESPLKQMGVNPFTGEPHEFTQWDPGSDTEPGSLVEVHGRTPVSPFRAPETDYQRSLEAAVPPLIRTFPHVAWKNTELLELEVAICGENRRADCFFGCTDDEGCLMHMPALSTKELAFADPSAINEMATRWRRDSAFRLGDDDDVKGDLLVLQQLARVAADGDGFLCSHIPL